MAEVEERVAELALLLPDLGAKLGRMQVRWSARALAWLPAARLVGRPARRGA